LEDRSGNTGPSAASRLQDAWLHRGLLACLLWPLSLLYAALFAVRGWLYRLGLLQTERVSVPVIVVGNVIAGGAGKTPVVMAVVQHLQARGDTRRRGVARLRAPDRRLPRKCAMTAIRAMSATNPR
jgi:tetraacyldisaccharide 4'-kinase